MIAHRTLVLIGSLTLALAVQADATTNHTVLSIVLESGNPGSTLNTGYNTIETASVKCPRSTCTFGMSIMASVSNATCTNEWAIVGLVDGNSVDGGPLQEALPHGGKQQTRTWQGAYQAGNGSHTLAFQIYVPCPVNADQWSVAYLVTTP